MINAILTFLVISFIFIVYLYVVIINLIDEIKDIRSQTEMESEAIDQLYDEVFPDCICSLDKTP